MNYLIITLRTGESLLPELRTNAWWVRLFRAGGITLSHKLVGIAHPLDQALLRNRYLLAHEAVHVVQARRAGWAWLLVYAWHALRAGFSYRDIDFEQDAYARERQILAGQDAEIASVRVV